MTGAGPRAVQKLFTAALNILEVYYTKKAAAAAAALWQKTKNKEKTQLADGARSSKRLTFLVEVSALWVLAFLFWDSRPHNSWGRQPLV